jgi:hypothetical protein
VESRLALGGAGAKSLARPAADSVRRDGKSDETGGSTPVLRGLMLTKRNDLTTLVLGVFSFVAMTYPSHAEATRRDSPKPARCRGVLSSLVVTQTDRTRAN